MGYRNINTEVRPARDIQTMAIHRVGGTERVDPGYWMCKVVLYDDRIYRTCILTSLGPECLRKPDLELGLKGRDHEPSLWLVGTPSMMLRNILWKLGGVFEGIFSNLLGDLLIWVEMGAVVLHCSV